MWSSAGPHVPAILLLRYFSRRRGLSKSLRSPFVMARISLAIAQCLLIAGVASAGAVAGNVSSTQAAILRATIFTMLRMTSQTCTADQRRRSLRTWSAVESRRCLTATSITPIPCLAATSMSIPSIRFLILQHLLATKMPSHLREAFLSAKKDARQKQRKHHVDTGRRLRADYNWLEATPAPLEFLLRDIGTLTSPPDCFPSTKIRPTLVAGKVSPPPVQN